MALLSSAVVRAQSTSGSAPQNAPTQQIPRGWVFTPSISSGGTWDDNVLMVNAESNPPADYGTPITPGASLDYNGKLTRFASGYSGTFVRYMTLDELNSLQQSLHADVDRRVNRRITLIGQESYTAAPTTDVLQLTGVPFYRIGSRSNAVSGGTQVALAKHTVLRSSYTLRTIVFDTNPLTDNQLKGGHAHEMLATVEQAVSRHFTVGGEYEFTRAIENGQVSIAGLTPENRFNMQTAMGTAEYVVAAGTAISGGVGVAVLGAGLTHEARTGPEWRAGISQKTGRAVVSVTYGHSYIPSFGFGGTFQNEELAANVRSPIGRTRAYVAGSFTWLNNVPLEPNQPSLKTAWLTGTAGYYLARWLTIEGFYERTQQDTQRPGGQIERNLIGFHVVASKPMKLR
jgi:uncharacterized protein (PEP-CTERM system associated)